MMRKSITQLHNELKNKTTTALNLLKVSQTKIEETKDLNAFTTLIPDSEEHAQTSQNHFAKGKPRSVIEGIPIAIKDNFCVKNVRTTCGSKMLDNFKPSYTATVVEKLCQSGGVLIGKTNMDEFAMGSGTVESMFGPTKNVWSSDSLNDWHICGGSSGGSATAVASGVCLGAIGSDTGGSTRNPASYCGIVGLKPTYGLLSRHGLIPLVNSMDVPGILTNNVEDAFILLKLMAGYDEKDSTTVNLNKELGEFDRDISLKGLRVGIPVEYNCECLSDEVRDTWKKVAEVLKDGGAEVMSLSMPHTKYSIVCYSVLNQCEVASNMAKYDGIKFGARSLSSSYCEKMFAETRSSNFNSAVRRRILAGNYFLLGRLDKMDYLSPGHEKIIVDGYQQTTYSRWVKGESPKVRSNYEKYFVKAMKVRRLIANDFLAAWNRGYDILLTPTTLTDAPEYRRFVQRDEREQCAREDYCTQPANMSGCPAVSIPIQLSQKGLPLSVQLMAPNFNDKEMLEVAHYIEKQVEFYKPLT